MFHAAFFQGAGDSFQLLPVATILLPFDEGGGKNG
jgi:hypothetical protein